MSVINYTINKSINYEPNVESKETLIFSNGFREFECKPIFSQNNLSCGKHKYEKFLTSGSHLIATVFGKITFSNVPLLCFKVIDGKRVLVATGSFYNVDPDRIILKKIILTGWPFKVNKSTAVIREMFYNPEDIRWFKPIQIYSKKKGKNRSHFGTTWNSWLHEMSIRF